MGVSNDSEEEYDKAELMMMILSVLMMMLLVRTKTIDQDHYFE